MNLSILICHLPSRKALFERLLKILVPQLTNRIEVLMDQTDISIGEKRNKLLQKAKGKYVCFIDDDDRISADYVRCILEGVHKNVDCCSLTGVITFDGQGPKTFIHSIEFDRYDEVDGVYIRYPNHLNTIRSTIAKQFKFPEINHGEDSDWATQVKNSCLLKTEYKIETLIYYYDFITNKNG